MGNDIGSGPVTGCHLWSLTTYFRLLICTMLVKRKSKQIEPEPMSSPINNPAWGKDHTEDQKPKIF